MCLGVSRSGAHCLRGARRGCKLGHIMALSPGDTGDNGALSPACVSETERAVSEGVGGAASWATAWRRYWVRLGDALGRRQAPYAALPRVPEGLSRTGAAASCTIIWPSLELPSRSEGQVLRPWDTCWGRASNAPTWPWGQRSVSPKLISCPQNAFYVPKKGK